MDVLNSADWYSEYKELYGGFRTAKDVLPPLDDAERLTKLEEMAEVYDLSEQVTEVKQIRMATRLEIQRINTIVAEFALTSHLIVVSGTDQSHKDAWHIDALAEDAARTQ